MSVVDGDTIRVSIGGTVYSVRYIGVDAPESGQRFAYQAATMNISLVSGKVVTLIKDVSEVDKYDRLLRYVVVGDVFVNYELVRRGVATAKAYPPDTSCHSTFALAEGEAFREKEGMWAPTPTPPPPPPSGSSGGNCHPSYPTVCIPPPPPDLDCPDIPYRRFKVIPPDPHRFDGDNDGIGCESG